MAFPPAPDPFCREDLLSLSRYIILESLDTLILIQPCHFAVDMQVRQKTTPSMTMLILTWIVLSHQVAFVNSIYIDNLFL